jgi:hypothetical protein
VTYLETLLIEQLNDEVEFSRLAPRYLTLTGQDSMDFLDTLASNHPLPWLISIQEFQHSLSGCFPEKSTVLDYLLSFFAGTSSFDSL